MLPVPSDSSSPAGHLRSVTPHATGNIAGEPCRALWVGGAGNIAVVASGDDDPVILTNVPAGTVLPVRAKAVRVSGTTATGIVALF